MFHFNAPIVASVFKMSLFLKRCAYAAVATVFLASCASKPKSISSTDAYAVQSVTVSSVASDGKFKSALEDALADEFSGEGAGLDSELNITVTNVRLGGNFTSMFYSSDHAATMNVVVRSAKTGLKLRDFKFSVTSNAISHESARAQMAEKARIKLKNIFKIRAKPKVITQARKEAVVEAKKKAKPVSVAPIADIKPTAVDDVKVIKIDNVEKPKLKPIAEVLPETAPEKNVQPVEIAPSAPPVKPETVVEAAAEKAVSAAAPAIEASKSATNAASEAEEDVLCVVTLENDCSQ